MEGKAFFQRKSIGEYLAILAAVVSAGGLIFYCSYTGSMGTTDTQIVAFIVGAVLCNLVYFLVDTDSVIDIGILEIVASVLSTLTVARFFLDSWSNLADLLNGIQIFSGGRGSVSSIITILVIFLCVNLINIISCFMKKNKTIISVNESN